MAAKSVWSTRDSDTAQSRARQSSLTGTPDPLLLSAHIEQQEDRLVGVVMKLVGSGVDVMLSGNAINTNFVFTVGRPIALICDVIV